MTGRDHPARHRRLITTPVVNCHRLPYIVGQSTLERAAGGRVSIDYSHRPGYRETNIPDPYARPELLDGLLCRCALSYLMDAFCIGSLGILCWVIVLPLKGLTQGLLWPGRHGCVR